MEGSSEKSIRNIVIVGAGAGGLPLATRLGRRYATDDTVNVKLVDHSMVHVWKPLLHEVVAGTLTSNDDEINLFSHGETNGYDFCYGRMASLDRREQKIRLGAEKEEGGKEILPERALSYDLLVMAVGGTCDDFGTEGVTDHAVFIDDRINAEACHRRFVHALLRRQYGGDDEPGSIVIVGAGATGVELAAQLKWVVDAHNVPGSRHPRGMPVKIILLEAADQCLPALEKKLAERTLHQLQEMGVDIRLKTAVERVGKNFVETAQGRIDAELIVWAAGVKAHDWLGDLDLEIDKKNRIVTNSRLQSTADERIFAMGDCAAVPSEETVVPALAQASFQEAQYLERQLPKWLEEEKVDTPFRFVNKGTLIELAGHDAVGTLRSRLVHGLRIYGHVAKTAYGLLYRRHQLSIIGPWLTFIAMAKSGLSRTGGPQSGGPRLKLH